MKIKNLILKGIAMSACIALVYSCQKSVYNKISQEEEDGWAIYKLKQTFNFISTQGNLIGYHVGGRFKAYTRNGNSYNEYLYTTIYLDHDTLGPKNPGNRGVFLDKTTEGLKVTIGLPHFYGMVQINKMAPVVKNINGSNYPDVYVVAANPFYLDSINYIDTIYYSQSYGFLKYVDRYGETYTITH